MASLFTDNRRANGKCFQRMGRRVLRFAPPTRLRASQRLPLIGIMSAFFEAALYVFIFLWTPVLERAAARHARPKKLRLVCAGFHS